MATVRNRLRSERVNLGPATGDPNRVVAWPIAAVGGAVLVATSCWLVVTAVAVVGWLQAPDMSFAEPLRVGTQWWLLAHGGGLRLGSTPVTVVPLGVTLGCWLMAFGVAHFAGRQARLGEDQDASERARLALAGKVGAAFGATYVVCVMVASGLVGVPTMAGRTLVGALLVGLVAGCLGAMCGAGVRVFGWLPDGLSPVPRAVGVGLATMAAFGLAVFVVGLSMRWGQVVALQRSLNPGTGGGIVLVLLQLTWWPNFVLWCGSWALGAGFQIGVDAFVTPAATSVGLVPALPVLGALPPTGIPPLASFWWLASGVIAGGVAGAIIVLGRPRARFDQTALVGGLAGVLVGGLWTALTLVSNGALGIDRLAQVGARMGPLAVMAPVVMGLSGIVVGLVIGLMRRRHRLGRAVVEESD